MAAGHGAAWRTVAGPEHPRSKEAVSGQEGSENHSCRAQHRRSDRRLQRRRTRRRRQRL